MNADGKDGAIAVIEQARWILERLERINEGLLARASALIGFNAIELGIISQVLVRNSGVGWSVDALVIGTALLLICALISLLKCISLQGDHVLPNWDSLFADGSYANGHLVVIKGLEFPEVPVTATNSTATGSESPSPKFYDVLMDENNSRAKHYKRGLWATVMAQVYLTLLIIANVIVSSFPGD